VHNVPESFFDRTIESIREAVEVKRVFSLDVTIGIQYLIIDENMDDIENALQIFSELGVDYISLKPYSLHPQMIKKKETMYTDKVINRIDETVDEYRKKTYLQKRGFKKIYGKGKNVSALLRTPFLGIYIHKWRFLHMQRFYRR
jgi:hypothetical protein